MGKYVDLTGQKFGKLTAIEPVGRNNRRNILWRCMCDCGNEYVVSSHALSSGNTRSCGCYRSDCRIAYAGDYVGKRYGRLIVDSFSHMESHKRIWKCLCDCGNVIYVSTNSLNSGGYRSCGCLHLENLEKIKYSRKLNDGRDTPEGKILHTKWISFRRRCNYPSDKSYPRYGGRGIYVCDEWQHSFAAFYTWAMENGYSEGLTLDRIDNDGPYSPDNCRWVGLDVQANNKSNNVFIECDGERHTIAQWARIFGIEPHLLYSKRYSG